MKAELYRTVATLPTAENGRIIENILSAPARWLAAENRLLTRTVGETVTNRHALLLSHSTIAFVALCGSPAVGAAASVISLVWFATTLYLCRKGGLK